MTLQEVVLVHAVQQFTDHARRHAHRKAFADKQYPTGREVEDARVAVNALCDEMDVLWKNPRSTFADFELLWDKMGRSYLPMNIDYLGLISSAFDSAGRFSAPRLSQTAGKAA